MKTPFDKIKELLSHTISLELIEILPDKWEKIGNVLVIKLDKKFYTYKEEIGKTYAEALDCNTVLNDIGGIKGIYREPNVELIYGSNETETIHKENGIRFKLDVKKIMFSSGNMDERLFMANVSYKNEIVVDLFAGIGYFTLPMAVYSNPKKIFACEINPIAYNYLCENIVLNHVTSIVHPLIGDNRIMAPKNVADRVILGYFENTKNFLPMAFKCLRNSSGIIHYHNICSEKKIPKTPFLEIKEVADSINIAADLITYRKIKSYAPGITHVVLDVKIGE